MSGLKLFFFNGITPQLLLALIPCSMVMMPRAHSVVVEESKYLWIEVETED
jgi:hypothetical protein